MGSFQVERKVGHGHAFARQELKTVGMAFRKPVGFGDRKRIMGDVDFSAQHAECLGGFVEREKEVQWARAIRSGRRRDEAQITFREHAVVTRVFGVINAAANEAISGLGFGARWDGVRYLRVRSENSAAAPSCAGR